MASSRVEDYLKRIYLEGQRTGENLVPMGRLAAMMDVAPGTVTSMVKALAEAGLVQYVPYAGAKLSRRGERLALRILRRHRLLEVFLVEVLGMDWSEVHPEAERLEHAVSERVIELIDEFLGRPEYDPHGDPIPNAKGRVPGSRHPHLAASDAGARLVVVRVLDQSPEFLRSMADSGVTPGAKLAVVERNEAADTMLVRPGRRRGTVTLGGAAASKILVRPA